MSLRKQLYDSVLKFGVSGEDREDWQSLYCSTSFLPPLVAVFSVGLILIVPVGLFLAQTVINLDKNLGRNVPPAVGWVTHKRQPGKAAVLCCPET